MKTTGKIAFAVLASLMLIGCSQINKGNTFTELSNGKTLFVGENKMYKNTYVEETNESRVAYEAYAVYNLYRSSYQSSANSVYYNGYYYYWNKSTSTNDYLVLGDVTTKTNIKYSYMSYAKDEKIVVRTQTTVTIEYSYKSGFHDVTRTVDVNLNGYFSSLYQLQNDCSDLYAMEDFSTTKKIYSSAVKRTTTNSTYETFNTYFYVE